MSAAVLPIQLLSPETVSALLQKCWQQPLVILKRLVKQLWNHFSVKATLKISENHKMCANVRFPTFHPWASKQLQALAGSQTNESG